jgi:redox-sensitive bicupin YhaK (pirin superfamily)
LCHKGNGTINGSPVKENGIVRLDASDDSGPRAVELTAGAGGASYLIFSGKRLNEPVAWRGPIVMNTDAEIEMTFTELRRGTFLKKRAPWNYKKISTKPK